MSEQELNEFLLSLGAVEEEPEAVTLETLSEQLDTTNHILGGGFAVLGIMAGIILAGMFFRGLRH